MNRNEFREIHHSMGEIERQLQDIQSTLVNDPEYREVVRQETTHISKKTGKKREATAQENPPKKKQRKAKKVRDWRDEDPCDPGTRFKDSKRKPPYVIINLPAKQHRKVYRDRTPVPIGEKWVHAGCNVFVRRDVYRCFTRVRDALADQMNATFQGNWND